MGSVAEKEKTSEIKPQRRKILVTGSNGLIGGILSEHFAKSFSVVGVDKRSSSNDKTSHQVDLSQLKALQTVFNEVRPEYVIHLAANSDPETSWEEIETNNIKATYNVYKCARESGVKRIIYASSTHLFGGYEGYPDNSPMTKPDDPRRPDSYYGVSKGFGEDLARFYFDKYGIETIALRIGHVTNDNKPQSPYESLWLSHPDVSQVFEKALTADVPFGAYFAMSQNQNLGFDIEPTMHDLGYIPQDPFTT